MRHFDGRLQCEAGWGRRDLSLLGRVALLWRCSKSSGSWFEVNVRRHVEIVGAGLASHCHGDTGSVPASMSVPEFEESLVKIYVDKVAALAVNALSGADVRQAVATVVSEAAVHFATVTTSTELGNLRRFAGQLDLRATTSDSSQPQARLAFEHAKGLADVLIKSKVAELQTAETEIPYGNELAALSPNFRQALAVRCALRAAPLLGKWGDFEFWGSRATTRRHVESIARALQSGLINCTANSTRTDELKEAMLTARNAALVAADAAKAMDERVGAVIRMAAHAADGGDMINLDALLTLLTHHKAVYPGSGNAALRDFERLQAHSAQSMNWAPPDFFRSPLWPGGEPKEWLEDRSGWLAALEAVGLAGIERDYLDWCKKGVEAGSISEAMAEVIAWAGRYRETVPQTGLRLDPEDDLAADTSPAGASDASLRDTGRVESRFGNDAVATEDALDRVKLARVLATFLNDPRTRTPLTLSIEGEWGSGKTTFMGLLQQALIKDAALRSEGRVQTIWFNPWRHQTHEELWAAFALKVTEEIAAKIPPFQRFQKWRQLQYRLFDLKAGWRDVATFVLRSAFWLGAMIIAVGFISHGLVAAKAKDWLGLAVSSAGGLLAVFATVDAARKKVHELVGSPFEIDLKRHLSKPDYADKASFLAKFQKHFRDFCRIYVPATDRIVVFIDDLDRCDVPRAVELMQAINLMLSDDVPFVYVLGMDRAKVAAGVAVKHRDLLPFLYARELALTSSDQQAERLRMLGLEHGFEFLEKFIQLPFRVPPCESDQLRGFVRSRLTLPETPVDVAAPKKPVTRPVTSIDGGEASPVAPPLAMPVAGETAKGSAASTTESRKVVADESHLEAPLLHASRVLGDNPRRIAQLVNMVRLQRMLAPVIGVSLRDGQLAKWTAVGLRWPLFIFDSVQEHMLLEQLVTVKEPDQPTARFRHWRNVPELIALLRSVGPTGDDRENYDLTAPGVVAALLRIGVAVPVADEGKARARAVARALTS